MCKPLILQRLDFYIYVDVILFVVCKENHTICNVCINLTHTMFGSCFTSCLLEGACLIYVNCVCLCIVVSNIHCVLLLLCFISSCFFFRIQAMFSSSLPPVVCKRTHVLLTLFVFPGGQWCPTHIVLGFLFLLWFFLCLV